MGSLSAELVKQVATLLNDLGGDGKPRDQSPDIAQACLGDLETTHRISLKNIIPNRHDQKARGEILDLLQSLLQDTQVDEIIGIWSEGPIVIETLALPGAALGLRSPKVGVTEVRVDMQRAEKHAWILVEDLLRAVAMMIVYVQDRNWGALSPLSQKSGGDGGVIQVAVTAMQIRRGVMAGRPAQCIDSSFAPQERAGRGQCALSAPVGSYPGASQDWIIYAVAIKTGLARQVAWPAPVMARGESLSQHRLGRSRQDLILCENRFQKYQVIWVVQCGDRFPAVIDCRANYMATGVRQAGKDCLDTRRNLQLIQGLAALKY